MTKSAARNEALTHYKCLQEKVEVRFNDIATRNPNHFRCFEHCHSCCKSGLRISSLEALAIHQHLEKNPKIKSSILALESRRAEKSPKSCPFLAFSGECSIYEVRPLVCRSHGAPLRFKQEARSVYRVCDLNFRGIDIANLNNADVIDRIEIEKNLRQIQEKTDLKPESIPLSASVILERF